MKLLNQGFDHVEFSVNEIAPHEKKWEAMGFEKVADVRVSSKGARHVVMAQGFIRLLLTEYDSSKEALAQPGFAFLKAHGDGICVLAAEVEDSAETYREVVAKGARPAMEPTAFETPDGILVLSEVYTPADFRYRFVQRKASPDFKKPAPLIDGVTVDRLESPSPTGLFRIDHLTNNIDMGQFETWLDYYTKIFGFKAVRRFNIKTGRTGLLSDVVQSSCGRIKVPINEATEPESQVQEFVNRFKGAGVQHLALQTTDIIGGLRTYRSRGFKFLTIPHSYYEVVPTRVPGVTEDLAVLEDLGILLDGEGGGYLMQIFTEELVGPFFLEFIQRKGNDGFGEGNFKALFEAIERDQIRRGVLKA
ncbi:MAG: 4-hydroxyphenylpyruvate dioxygenase [Proteobacteria bacterium]|nr:4-hydroxyphenylpyruvate dioxygenase [Pseudomonadota bacterium]